MGAASHIFVDTSRYFNIIVIKLTGDILRYILNIGIEYWWEKQMPGVLLLKNCMLYYDETKV